MNVGCGVTVGVGCGVGVNVGSGVGVDIAFGVGEGVRVGCDVGVGWFVGNSVAMVNAAGNGVGAVTTVAASPDAALGAGESKGTVCPSSPQDNIVPNARAISKNVTQSVLLCPITFDPTIAMRGLVSIGLALAMGEAMPGQSGVRTCGNYNVAEHILSDSSRDNTYQKLGPAPRTTAVCLVNGRNTSDDCGGRSQPLGAIPVMLEWPLVL